VLALHDGGVVPASVVLTRLDDGTRLARGSQFTVARDGMLRIVDTAAVPPGTACRVEFIPRPVSRLSLDAESGRRVMDLLRTLALRDGRAVAIVTHDSRTFEYADRIVTIADGRLAETPHEREDRATQEMEMTV